MGGRRIAPGRLEMEAHGQGGPAGLYSAELRGGGKEWIR